MAKKYLKNEKGIVRAVTSENLQLEKPLLNENYDIEVHNRNMDKIDNAIQEVKGKIDGLELVASNVKMADGTTVEDTVSANKTSILNNTNLANQALNKANEAFQRGDEVKGLLVDKLISEGLNVSTNNTFEELISGITLGKKWASGKGVSTSSKYSFTFHTGAAYSIYYLDINIDFDFTIIKAEYKDSSETLRTVIFKKDGIYEGNTYAVAYASNSTAGGRVFRIDEKVFIGNNIIRIPITRPSYDVDWIAYE